MNKRQLSRRSFLTGAATGGGIAVLGTGCANQSKTEKAKGLGKRNHPLEGIARENITITDVKVTPISYVPPDGRILWIDGDYEVWKTDGALTEVFTDQGIIGIGEGTPYEHPLVLKKYTEEYIKPLLVGQNPFDVEYLTCNGFNRKERAPWAGVDNALWDIIGKAAGLPVFRILDLEGTADARIHIYASGGNNQPWYAEEEAADNLIEEALQHKENGYDLFKFRKGTTWGPSGMTLDKYIPIMGRLREAVGPDFRLVHETTNGTGLSFDEVINGFCPMLEDLGFYWFEDPIGSPAEYGRVREALDKVMVSGHFSQTNRFDVKEWIDRDYVDITQMDCNIGGITECFYVAHAGALKGKIHCPHNWHGGLTTISNAHLTAAIPNRHYCELNQTFNPLKEGVFKEPLTVKDGWMELPEKPGYGVEVIDDIEKKFPYVEGSYQRHNSRLPS